ncbi:DNA-binding transcriptional regulator, LysR family [Enhydrobacter aerosaccus]|uniref:DNA-binding transcriptional regulator, LysR family n=1 Tax=Enhydrobacter aerosaccus TaxID=225324 RepID=A0A1T4QB52_9HYPH|nr:LysR family transcriptional regulator [Enhydrobacter aerosaccus]SKA00771.1 DNA-binding transcriptional regulator, LysR family [Enhydrobacter aerosaccus]
MDLRQLQTLLVVAEVGSLKKASLRLRIVETALSRQIRLLEEELRTPLFERHGRGLTPTDAGRRMIERARPILADLEQLKAEMQSRRNAVAGKVAVGLPWLLLDALSARLATGFIPRYPAVNIRLVGGISNQLRRMLQAGDLDIALYFDIDPASDPSVTPLFSERMLLVGGRSCGYRLDRPLPFAHLAKVPLALPEREEPFRAHLEAVARERKFSLDVRFEVGALQALRALAMNGLAHIFASLHAVRADLDVGLLTAAPIQKPIITRTLVLGRSRSRTPTRAAQLLAGSLEDDVRAMAADGSFLLEPGAP